MELDGARIEGIEAPLPPGERVLWTGRPLFWPFARSALRLPLVWAYFAVLIGWRIADDASRGGVGSPRSLAAVAFLLVLGVIVTATLLLYAHATRRATVYAVTDRRVIIKVGLILPRVVNVPFRQIDSVSIRLAGGQVGDLAFALARPDRLALTAIWPHARPWHINWPQPAFRAIPDVASVGTLVRKALISGGAISDPHASLDAPREAVAAARRRDHTGLSVAAATVGRKS